MRRIVLLIFIMFISVGNIFAAIAAEDLGGLGLKANQKAKDFMAVNANGDTINLADYLSQGPVVLIFYRGGWCPYCNLHLRELEKHSKAINDLGATILAVSVDTRESAGKTVEKENITFEIISNPEADILKDYRLVYQVPEELKEKYLNEYDINLEKASGRDDGIIAIPAVYIIEPDYNVYYAYVNEDYKVRMSPDEIVSILEDYRKVNQSDSINK